MQATPFELPSSFDFLSGRDKMALVSSGCGGGRLSVKLASTFTLTFTFALAVAALLEILIRVCAWRTSTEAAAAARQPTCALARRLAHPASSIGELAREPERVPSSC